ncbi:hypothetical protein PanWU01x14_232410 [Parasponia andersonii]|uniref:Uncharacterized protein n=1 Tax=Parasponia andersonii TaxID=3476 RepID=A0A2P5BJX6_PARAD|nr:hypothetical protein PanWU01x14_232410 [Parasponia andersonii]
MTQMWPLWWPKNTFTTKRHGETVTTATTASTAISSCNSFSTSSHCPCLTKMMRKLKKHARMIGLAPSQQASTLQCSYDPLSYSLNFDDTSTGCRNLLDEDYYQFCAFSSRFVANPRTCPRPVALSH